MKQVSTFLAICFIGGFFVLLPFYTTQSSSNALKRAEVAGCERARARSAAANKVSIQNEETDDAVLALLQAASRHKLIDPEAAIALGDRIKQHEYPNIPDVDCIAAYR